MIFVPIYRLKDGMRIADDIQSNCNNKLKTVLLKSGSILTKDSIEKLYKFDVSGIYIDDGINNPLLNDDLRKESVFAIKEVFSFCEKNHTILNEKTMQQIEGVSDKLVEQIYNNKEISVCIKELQTYDSNTYIHSVGVAVLSIAIGTALNLSRNELCRLGVSALLHDIGKVQVPIEIINKPSKLTDEEFEIIKNHPTWGGIYFAENKNINDDIYMGIVGHHERIDGTGYPNGLKDEDIPLFARIIAVADVYESLTGNRSYRKPIRPLEAIEYIMAGSERSFDKEVVKAFLRKIEPYPVGAYVKLSDKRSAKVIKSNVDNSLRPVIRIKGDDKIIDLQNDASARNLVILDFDYDSLVRNEYGGYSI
ncbi:MAG: HD-GYP domain-containing protein [Clostridium sp.]